MCSLVPHLTLSYAPSPRLPQSCDKLVMLMRGVFDKNFDMFEIYSLRNVLKVPAEALEDEVGKHTIRTARGRCTKD